MRNQFADYSWRRTKRSYAGRWVPWVLTHGLSDSGEYKRGWKLSSQNSLDLLCLCNKFSSLTPTCFIVIVFGKFCFVLKNIASLSIFLLLSICWVLEAPVFYNACGFLKNSHRMFSSTFLLIASIPSFDCCCYFSQNRNVLVYRYETCHTSYWFTRCCCLSAAPCLCLLPRQSQRWVAALNLKCISTSMALGKLLLFYTAFACLEDQEPRLLTFFSFSMNNYSRIWDSWYTSLLHSLPVPTCLRPLFCNISIYFEQRLKTK